MRETILNFPKQFSIINKTKLNIFPKKYKRVVLCGEGGSALGGEIIKMLFPDINFQTFRSYSIPFELCDTDLFILSSFSGNTEETISCFDQVYAKFPQNAFVLTSGGKILDLAKKHNVPFIEYLEKDIQPRCALGYHVASIVLILNTVGLISDAQKDRLIQAGMNAKPKDLEEAGKNIAKKIKGFVPVIYASDTFLPAARIMKIKINENAKSQAFFNVLPEMNHNEMQGYEFSKLQKVSFFILFLHSKFDLDKISKRFLATQEILSELNIKTDTIELPGNSIEEELIGALILGDWISYYLALEIGIDPIPVRLVELLKEKLKN